MARDGHVPPYLDEFVIFSSFHFLSLYFRKVFEIQNDIENTIHIRIL